MGEQEKWIIDHKDKVWAEVFIGAGGSLDLLSGFAKRAPKMVRKLGLEWFWRLLNRPSRHWRRVINAVVVFPWLVFREKIRASFKSGGLNN